MLKTQQSETLKKSAQPRMIIRNRTAPYPKDQQKPLSWTSLHLQPDSTTIPPPTSAMVQAEHDRIAKRRQFYQDLPMRIPSPVNIDDRILEPLRELYPLIADEFKHTDINFIVERYEFILNNFHEYTSHFRSKTNLYDRVYTTITTTLTKIYKLNRRLVYVNFSKYTTTLWGHLYWNFLHYTAILLNDAYNQGKIKNLLDFPMLVYNIDTILPCSICIAHYRTIKNTPEVREVIKSIAFGFPVGGLMRFHNLITQNVQQQHKTHENTDHFTVIDFTNVYKCLEMEQNTDLLVTDTYINTYLEWHTDTHIMLSILFSIYCPQLFHQGSMRLKQKLYSNNPIFKDAPTSKPYQNYNFPQYDMTAVVINGLQSKQIEYCLVRALLMQLQDTLITNKDMTSKTPYLKAIILIYHKHPDIIRKIIHAYFNYTKPQTRTTNEPAYVQDTYPTKEYLLHLVNQYEKLT